MADHEKLQCLTLESIEKFLSTFKSHSKKAVLLYIVELLMKLNATSASFIKSKTFMSRRIPFIFEKL